MQTRISIERSPEKVSHLVVDAEGEVPLTSISSAIAGALGHTVELNAKNHQTWDELGLLEGSVIASDPGREKNPIADEVQYAPVLLNQVSGAGAGKIRSLGPGKYTFGSDAYCTFVVEDPSLPAVAALVSIDETGACTVENSTEESVVYLEGQRVTEPVAWEQGHSLRMGEYVFEVLTQKLLTASVSASDRSGLLDFNRPPRLMPKVRETDFKYPTEPEPGSKGALPLIGMMVPLLLAVVLAVVMKRPYFLIFGLMSPVMMLANYISNRKNGKVTYREKKAKYRKVRARVEDDLHQAVVDFANERRLSHPDPATAGLIATLPSPRLWERRRADPDHLTIRLGVSEVQSDVSIYRPEEVDHLRTQKVSAKDVPAAVSFRQFGVVGLCGEDDVLHRSAAWMVGQLAIMQSPRDLSLVILTDSSSEKEWEWTRWLPHTASSKGAVAAIGNDTRTVGQRLNELAQLIEQRQEHAQEKDPGIFRAVVVVFDGARKLRQWPGASRVLAEGPAVGVYALCLDSEERFLPEESRAICIARPGQWVLKRDREDTLESVTPDLPEWNWFEWVARAIAPIRDVSNEGDSAIPASARFLETIVMEDPEPQLVMGRWMQSPRSTSAVIGESFDGAFAIDIRQEGPHMLIAGTTGSGKSELLQTLIASLALGNRPDELNFVLIDYKGGAAFKDFVNLPHTAGIVTDLDAHLVQRAMDSLSAELRRREHLLATVGAKDIEDFTAARDRGETTDLMPRLVLVIDEFAALKAELPEFVAGIVNIAQRGRSLGIHLVMATQRPQGAITADILANTNLRIALRMADTVESKDVLGTADAAEISTSTPGRAYMKAGSDPLMPFQSSRIGGIRPSLSQEIVPDPVVDVVPWNAVGYSLPEREKAADSDSAVTDLQVLVSAMVGAAERMKVVRQPSPWLDPLSENITLEEVLASFKQEEVKDLPRIPFGMQDFPEEQDQRPVSLDFEDFTHLFIIGSPRAGRTQTLRTIAGSIARSVSANDVHLYGVDFGNGGLQAMLQLPHCNTVISRVQEALLARFVTQVGREVASRRSILAQGGYASVVEQRRNVPAEERIPHMVILFDQWEGFRNGIGDDGNSTVGKEVLEILREGASVGIHLIITGDRSLLSTKTSALVEHKFVLRLADRSDYDWAGLSAREMPDTMGAGRAFEVATSRETQFALLDSDTSSQAQIGALSAIGREATAAQGGRPLLHEPEAYKDFATKVSYSEMLNAAGGLDALVPFKPLLGIGGDELAPVAVDLIKIPSFIVGGSARSGKSTVLKTLARSSLDAGVKVALLAPLRSPLRDLADHENVLGYYEGTDITGEPLREVMSRKDVLLVIDDMSAINDISAGEELKKLSEALDNGLRVIAADDMVEWERIGGTMWATAVTKRRHGAVLNPEALHSGKNFGITLTPEVRAQSRSAGRALVNLGDSRVTVVQVAREVEGD